MTISYTITQIGANGQFIVQWPALAENDDGDPFDASDAILISIQSYNATPGSISGFMMASNDPEASPAHVTNIGRLIGALAAPAPIQARWYKPTQFIGTGSLTVSALFRTIA